MMPSADSLQLLLVDGLFICLAGAMGLWFRAWIKAQRRALDSRLDALESHQESLDRLGSRLLAACRSLESMVAKQTSIADNAVSDPTRLPPQQRRLEVERGRSRSAAAEGTTPAAGGRSRFQGEETGTGEAIAGDSGRGDGSPPPARRADSEGIRGTGFARARDLLAHGLPAKEVARRLAMDMAEVEALKRMMDLEPRSARIG